MVTRYGDSVLAKFAIGAVVILVVAFVLVSAPAVRYSLAGFIFVVTALVVNFFRDPERRTPDGARVVVSPADGKVVVIKDLFEPEYLKRDATQVSIFMSPLDVHVNRFPISGIIEHFEHVPGKFSVAFNNKSSDRNERTHIGVRDADTKIFFKQIAGAVARRIVADVKVGQRAIRGERFGMIRFGSRVDVIVPKPSEVKVQLNERVRAGETILAKLSPAIEHNARAEHSMSNTTRLTG